jgi:hypothetical protein
VFLQENKYNVEEEKETTTNEQILHIEVQQNDTRSSKKEYKLQIYK